MTAPHRASGSQDEVVDELRALRDRLIRRRGVHHVAIGAAPLDGSWAWTDAAGVADAAGTPMRADTPWMIASITKLHIASVILRLHELGQLDVDAPIARVLPEDFRERLHVHDGIDHTAELTPAHLLGHLSGLPDYLEATPRGGSSLIEDVVAGPDRSWTPEDAVRHARDRLTPHFPPSDPNGATPRIRYSDTNFQLLVVVAQYVTGRSMDELYRDLLYEPLDLVHTWRPGTPPPPTATSPATVWLGATPFDDRPLALASFGDLYSTTEDLLRFGRALFTGGLFDDASVGARMHQRFHRFGLPRNVAALRAPSWPIEYGSGLMRFELGRVLGGGIRVPTLVGHTGSTGSWLWHVPDLGLVVAGTVSQTTGAAVPFRQVARTIARLAR
jgi:D-alanyl-D-alanine carboxypeptidase